MMTLPLPVHEVRYEDMHARPLQTARQLYAFCGIPIDDELLATLVDQAHFSKLPRTGPDQFRRSGRVGDWVTEWNHLERLLFSAAAGEVLERCGYAPAMIPQARPGG
jgi:hypothetical protein